MSPAKSYNQFCPVSKAAEVFAERWTPLILREMLMGSRRFNEIEQGCPRISRSLLTQRLRSLEQAELVERRIGADGRTPEYHLTQAGQELYGVIELLGEWGQRWANHEVGPSDVEPTMLLWDMRRRLHRDRLPDRHLVIQFDFTGVRAGRYWLVIEHRDASVCHDYPGREPDLYVTADTIALHQVWVGQLDLAVALRTGQVRLEGPRDLVRAFPTWLALSTFAHIKPVPRAAQA